MKYCYKCKKRIWNFQPSAAGYWKIGMRWSHIKCPGRLTFLQWLRGFIFGMR